MSNPRITMHHCHAIGCTKPCPPKYLMCARHWFMVRARFRQAVWTTYRAGQEADKRPSREWMVAAEIAICDVAIQEGRLTAEEGRRRVRNAYQVFLGEELLEEVL